MMAAPATTLPGASAGESSVDALDDLSTGVVIGNSQTQVEYANAAAEAALGLSRTRLIGATLGELPIAASDDLLALFRESQSRNSECTHRGVEMAQGAYDCTVNRRADGGFIAELTAANSPLSGRSSAIQLTRQAAIDGLLRGLAHEVNNPLGGMRGAAQLLEQRLQDPRLSEYTQLIVGEVDRLAALVKRVTQPRARFEPTPVNVHEVCERVRSLIENDASLQLEVERDFDPSLPEVRGDRDRLIQAVLNLARNAWQAGASKLTLVTRIARQQVIGQVVQPLAISLQISDNGEGIDDSLLESMFYPLISGRADGTGIGLAQAQGAAIDHGGIIECTRARSPTTFAMLLPVSP